MPQNKLFSVVIQYSAPYIIAFALYVQVSGSDAPGGGFQAGAILAAAMVLCGFVYGEARTLKILNFKLLKRFAVLGFMLYAGTGIVWLLKGGKFLDYQNLEFGFVDINAQAFGIALAEWGVAFTVFSILCLIYFSFSKNHDAH